MFDQQHDEEVPEPARRAFGRFWGAMPKVALGIAVAGIPVSVLFPAFGPTVMFTGFVVYLILAEANSRRRQ